VGLVDGASRVADEAEAAGERFAQALSALGLAAGWVGHHARARALWERSIELAAAEDKPYPVVVCPRLACGHPCLYGGRRGGDHAHRRSEIPSDLGEGPLPEWKSIVH
jgi:hypothetical protein